MPYDNKFFLGVRADGYVFFAPPQPLQVLSDLEALELAALIVASKPHLRSVFADTLKRVEGS